MLKTIENKYRKINELYSQSITVTNGILSILSEDNFEEVQKLITQREKLLFTAERLLTETKNIKNEIDKKNNNLNKNNADGIAAFSDELTGTIEAERLKLIELIKTIQNIQLKIEIKFDSIKNDINKKINNAGVTKKIHNAYNKNKIIKPVGSFLF